MSRPTPPTIVPVVSEGTFIQLGDGGATEIFNEIAGVLNIKPPGGKVAEVEKTHLRSTSKRYRPSRVPEAGEVTFRIQYNPNDATHQSLTALVAPFDSAVKYVRNWKVVYNDDMTTNAIDSFSAFVTSFEPDDAENEKNVEADLTIRIDGPVVRTPGA